MIRTEFLQGVHRYTSAFSIIGATIFQVDPRTNYTFYRDCFLRFKHRLLFTYFTLYMTYLLIESFRFFIEMNGNPSNGTIKRFYVTYIFFLAFSIPYAYICLVTWRGDDLTLVMNWCVQMFRKILPPNETHLPESVLTKDKKNTMIVEKFLLIISIWFPAAGLCYALHFLIFPHWPIYATYELSLRKHDSNWHLQFYRCVYALLAIPHGLLMMNITTQIVISMGFFLIISSHIIELLIKNSFTWNRQQLVPSHPSNFKNITPNIIKNQQSESGGFLGLKSKEFGHWITFMVLYRQMNLLYNQANHLYGVMLLVCQASVLNALLAASYFLIKHGDEVDMELLAFVVMYTTVIWGLWCGILEVCGRLHDLSSSALTSWNEAPWGSARWAKIMTRFKKSCKPLQVRKGTVFSVDRLTVVVFQDALCTGVFEALLVADE